MIWYLATIPSQNTIQINSITKLLEGNQRNEDVLLRSKIDQDGNAVFYYGVLEKNRGALPPLWAITNGAVQVENAPDSEACNTVFGRF